MENFRNVTSVDEMKAVLLGRSNSDYGIIWQTCAGKRKLWPLTAIQTVDDQIILASSEKLQVDQSYPLFVKIAHRTMIFKLSLGEYDFVGTQLVCRYPKEAKALEGRLAPRTKMPKKTSVQLTLRSMGVSSMMDSRILLQDLSDGGLGGTVSRVNQEFFLRHSYFQIVKIGERAQLEPTILTLKHITDQGSGNKLKLGFQLEAPLSDAFFATLREEMRKSVLR